MAVPVQAILNEGHLRLLIDEQHESETLDYKQELDLLGAEKTKALVELAKDVGAMASGQGGYLGIGLDGRGQPTGLLTEAQTKALDEANLRSKLEKYIPAGLDIRSAVHEIDGKLVCLIYVGAHPDGLIIFRADGNYTDKGKTITVFREGDVFVRHGTQSRRWSQADAQRWMRETERAAEQRAMERAASALDPVIQQIQRTDSVSNAPAEALNWSVDRTTLVSAITDQVRRGDDIPLRLLLDSAPRHVAEILARADREALSQEEWVVAQEEVADEVGRLLDALVSIAGRGVTIGRRELVDPALDALVAIYNLGSDERGFPRSDLLMMAEHLWLGIIERVYALGGLATRHQDWETVRKLAVVTPRVSGANYYRAWLRHGHIMAARANLLQDAENKQTGVSILRLALNHAVRLPDLRPDLGPGQEDALLTSLAQFDILANLAVIDEVGKVEGGTIHPHFRRFYAVRTDPAVVRVIEDPEARRVLFDRSDQELADALRALTEIGSHEFFLISGWDGFEDQRIIGFLEAHPPSAA